MCGERKNRNVNSTADAQIVAESNVTAFLWIK